MRKILTSGILVFLLLAGFGIFAPASIIQAVIPQVVPTLNKRGNSTVFALASSTAAGLAGTLYCDDGSGNLTASGCGVGSGFLLSGTVDPGLPTITPVQGTAIVNVRAAAFPGSVTSGNCLVLVAGWQNGTGLTLDTVTDTVGTTYSRVNGAAEGAGDQGVIYIGVAAASGANTITWTKASSTAPVTAIAEFSGTTCVLDTSAAQNTSQPSVTTTTPYDLLVNGMAIHSNTNTCTTTGAGVCYQGATGNNSVELGYQFAGVAGAYTVSLTSSFPANTAFITGALKPVAVATPGNDGNWYLNTTTGVLWGPRTGGVWAKSTAAWLSQVGANGQFLLTGSPFLGTCGTTPSLAAGSSNNAGTITVGTGVTTACTLNFNPAFTRAPSCSVSGNSTAITLDVSAVSTSAVTFSSSASVASSPLYYHCF